jgi:hypothetical protein
MEYGIKAITSSLSRPHQVPQEFQSTAAKGRGGDDTVAHLDSGEVVIPKRLQTPGLMALFAKNARSQRMDPSRFIVGSKQNNINPMTGLQEFRGEGPGPGPGGPGSEGGQGGSGQAGDGSSGGNSGNNSSRGAPVGSQGEFDSGQENNSRGMANAEAMGYGADNSDYGVDTPVSMFDYSDMPTASQAVVDAFDAQFAADNELSTEQSIAKSLAAMLGIDLSPSNLSPSVTSLNPFSKNPFSKSFTKKALDDDNYAAIATSFLADVSVPLVGTFGAIGNALGATHNANPDGSTDSFGGRTGAGDSEGGEGLFLPGDAAPEILLGAASPQSNGPILDTYKPTGFATGQLLADGSYLPNYLDFFDVSEDGSVELPPERQYLLDQFIYRNLPSLTA